MTLLIALIISLIIRLPFLGTIPSVINGDESGSLIHPWQILYEPHPNLFSLTHDGSVSYVVFFIKALAISLFGVDRSLLAVRLVTALFSVGALIPFYLLILPYFKKYYAFLAVLLFATAPWYLSFSRISFINVDSLFWGLWLIYFTYKYIQSKKNIYIILSSIFSVMTLHNYMGGRIFFTIAVLMLYKIQKKLLIFYLISVFLLFLPQLLVIKSDFTEYSRRAFSVRSSVTIHQLEYVIRGFILFDPLVSFESVENTRLMPPGSAALPIILVPLFITGLVYSCIKRKHFVWLGLFFLNLLLIQLPSENIPSWGRAISLLPSLVFLTTVGAELLNQKYSFLKFIIPAVFVICIIFNTISYWSWVNTDVYNSAQRPYLPISEFRDWQDLQISYIKAGRFPFTYNDWQDPLWKKQNLIY